MAAFRNILAVYDSAIGGDDVLVQAILLARDSGAKLTIAKILDDTDLTVAACDEAKRRLTRLVPWIAQEGVADVGTEILVGTPHVEITRQVVRAGHDLVISSAGTGRAISDIFRGSAATNLIRKCPCAVWIVKPGQNSAGSPVMVAVSAPVDRPACELETRLLDLGIALARAKDVPLHAVSCWDVDGSESEMVRSEIRDRTRRDILTKHREKHEKALDALIARCRDAGVDIRTHFPRGPHQRNIVSLAEELEAGLVVMGAQGRFGVSGLLMGNSAETVFDAAPCGVLSVKPDGFRTPIATSQAEKTPVNLGAEAL